MRYARIFDVHVPMTKTSLVFKATELEIPLIKQRWNDNSQRAKEQPITFTPMPDDGVENPFRPVGDADAEMRRVTKLWTERIFEKVYTVSQWEDKFSEKTIERNPWSVARAKAEAEAEAEKQALAAAATADLVHAAIERRVKADAEAAVIAGRRQTVALDQAAKDADTLRNAGSDDEAELAGAGARSTPKGRKA
jgi:hypothetical protein